MSTIRRNGKIEWLKLSNKAAIEKIKWQVQSQITHLRKLFWKNMTQGISRKLKNVLLNFSINAFWNVWGFSSPAKKIFCHCKKPMAWQSSKNAIGCTSGKFLVGKIFTFYNGSIYFGKIFFCQAPRLRSSDEPWPMGL